MESTWNQPLPRGRHHLSREEVSASQRQRILSALVEEVAARGYAATSVAHITARAGVSRKSFYEQFSDKEDCYYAAFDMAGEEQAHAVAAAIEGVTHCRSRPVEYFRAILGAFLDTIAANPAMARTMLVEIYAVGPDAVRRKAGRLDQSLALLLAPLGFANREGTLTFEGRAIVASIIALMTQLVAEGRTDEVPGLCEPFVEWVARHLDCEPGTIARAAGPAAS